MKELINILENIDRMNNKSIEIGKEPRHNITNKFTYIKQMKKIE